MKGILTILLMALSMSAFAQFSAGCQTDSAKIAEYREKIGLDYSMPDYSIKKIDEKVMGARLAKILKTLAYNYTQPQYMASLSVIQSSQVEGLYFGRIKSMKLGNVTKTGNDFTIRYNTTLEPNNLKLKKSQLVFHFVNGVSEDTAINDFFYTLCRYIKE